MYTIKLSDSEIETILYALRARRSEYRKLSSNLDLNEGLCAAFVQSAEKYAALVDRLESLYRLDSR